VVDLSDAELAVCPALRIYGHGSSTDAGLPEDARRFLRSIPGVEYVEMEEADWCCGGAGTYALAHPELSQQILARKMGNVEKTGARVLVAPCPSCLLQLSFGARKHRLPIQVKHLSEVLLGRR